MASVRLNFVPLPGYTKLHIHEAPTMEDAPGPKIETVTVDPASPPTRYTTNVATSSTDWFSIQWEDDKGGTSEMSEPIQGGTSTVVNEVVERVLLRNPTLDEQIAVQVAEWVVSEIFPGQDPYDVDPAIVTYRQWEGMTLLALARGIVTTIVSESNEESFTAGLVSMKSGSGSSVQTSDEMIKFLTDEANKALGIANAYVMVMTDVDPTGIGTTSALNWDHSRLALTINYE